MTDDVEDGPLYKCDDTHNTHNTNPVSMGIQGGGVGGGSDDDAADSFTNNDRAVYKNARTIYDVTVALVLSDGQGACCGGEEGWREGFLFLSYPFLRHDRFAFERTHAPM